MAKASGAISTVSNNVKAKVEVNNVFYIDDTEISSKFNEAETRTRRTLNSLDNRINRINEQNKLISGMA